MGNGIGNEILRQQLMRKLSQINHMQSQTQNLHSHPQYAHFNQQQQQQAPMQHSFLQQQQMNNLNPQMPHIPLHNFNPTTNAKFEFANGMEEKQNLNANVNKNAEEALQNKQINDEYAQLLANVEMKMSKKKNKSKSKRQKRHSSDSATETEDDDSDSDTDSDSSSDSDSDSSSIVEKKKQKRE